ncbi:protein ALP1-like isoform X2 [Aphis craccivora]|uniref:Protein ALP1-like isoform X2 n=1 Tax=Aphis craccivora TaxID=307492 RepID=A0A6G0YF24_APHCR|nr:protein ALP1-like isoform X2 [Aphis craccivora]
MNQQLKRQLYLNDVKEYNNQMFKRQICIISCCVNLLENHLKSERRWRVRPMLKERSNFSHFNTMLKEHQLSNSYLFFNFTRMSASAFEELLIIVGPSLQRSPSRPDVLCVGEIVGATLRYLATGESMVDIMFNFRIGKSTVSKLIFDCCNIIWDKLKDDLLFNPTVDGWLKISQDENFTNIPYYIVADEAFPLQTSIMRPYPGRGKSKLPIKEAIFNYRLSRARRCIENAFGILVARWRIYKRVIIASEKTINSIIKATVVLHNFVKNKETESVPVGQMGSNFYDTDAKEVRLQLTDYFSGEGSIPFQYLNV